MDSNLYDMILKRKSFHLFRNIGNEHITDNELKEIEEYFSHLEPLIEDIKVKMKIVKESTTCKRGIIPKDAVIYYNQIDIGIFLCFLELSLDKNNIKYTRTLYVEENHDNERNLTAKYEIG